MNGEVKLMIGTPTYDARVHIRHVTAVFGTVEHLRSNGVGCCHYALYGGFLAKSRNLMVQEALSSGATHLLFADADMGWPPEAVAHLLGWGRDAVGGVYQSRHDGCLEIADPRPVAGEAPLLEVSEIGAGLLLLSRACLERMVAAYPGRMFEFRHGLAGDPWAYVGEDMVFCERWRALGGKIYADPGFRVDHVGARNFDATLAEVSAGGSVPCIGRKTVPAARLAPTLEALA